MKIKIGKFSFCLTILYCLMWVSTARANSVLPQTLRQRSDVKGEGVVAEEQVSALQNPLALKRAQVTTRKKIAETLFVIIIGYIILFALISLINTRIADIKSRHVIRKTIVYFTNIVVLILIFFIWIQNIGSITIFLGFASAGVALALQEVILSIAGWILILMRRPYEVGDRIEINGIKGDVIDIRLFQTALLEIGNWVDADQSTGRIVNVPNSYIFKFSNYNYSRGFEFIWNELPLLVTFESDWARAKDIMTQHANQLGEGMEEKIKRKIEVMRNRYMIYYGKLTPIVYVNIKDSGIELTLRYLTEAKKRRSTQDYLCRKILEDFAKEANVDFAYPTKRVVGISS